MGGVYLRVPRALISVMSPLGHETDMPKYLGDVRCWLNSGKHVLALSFSGFDPDQT